MSDLPKQARVVIIGAGIVGNSVSYHLAQLGWKDIVLVDKGPLPNPGGSTGHASNFIYPIDHSKEMTLLTQDSMEQYREMGVFVECGGLEVARTAERVEELKRRVQSAKAWGEPAEILSPEKVNKKVPFLNTEVIKAGFWSPTAGVCDPLRAGTIMRERAQAMGALTLAPNTEVTAVRVKRGQVRAVVTDRGEIKTNTVVIAAGVWSPYIARLAGAFIPLTPLVHQMISAGPIRLFEETNLEIEYPIVRDVDNNMYERQNGSDLEIGSYAHRPIIHEPEEIPSIAESKLSPTELPFTPEDFDPQMEQALELMPEILDHKDVGVRHAINGLLSLTPDGFPLLGPMQEVGGLWSGAAVWIKEGPGIGKLLAEWMTAGYSEIDPHSSNINRFYEYGRTKHFVQARAREGYNKTYGIIHPREQWLSARPLRVSPFYEQTKALGAEFFETAGWERPQWYESNQGLLDEYSSQLEGLLRTNEWDSRWWSNIILGEHIALRERVGLVDLSAFTVFDLIGSGAVEYVQKVAAAPADRPVGTAIYTPILNENGGFMSDLTIMRTGAESYRVVTGGGMGGADKAWFRSHLPGDGSVHMHDQTAALCTLGLWGPRARDVLKKVTGDNVSTEGFPFATAREIVIDGVRAWALRISYVGELGWEIYAPSPQGGRLWDTLWNAGQEFGLVPVGIGVYGTTARLEKGYRLYGHELELEYNIFEAGLGTPLKSEDFIGKEATLKAQKEDTAAHLCTLTVDDHSPTGGEARFMIGHEPVMTPDGEDLVDRRGRRSYVTSAGTGPSVGKHILMAYIPAEYAEEGRQLAVEYMGQRYPVTIEVVGSRPLFDPGNERLKS